MRIPAKHPHHSVTLGKIQFGTLGEGKCLHLLFVRHAWLWPEPWEYGTHGGNTGAMGIREPWEYKELKAAVSAFMSRQYAEKQSDLTLVYRKGE